MNDVIFSPEGWSGYLYWQLEDRKTLKRINQLIRSIQRDGLSGGIGKPEPLRHAPGWSRRIDDKIVRYMKSWTAMFILPPVADTMAILKSRFHPAFGERKAQALRKP